MPAIRASGRLNSRFGGLGYPIAAACGCLLFALVAFLGVRQSPDEMLLWTGTKIVGSEHNGVISYRWDHRQYTFDAPGYTGRNSGIPVHVSKPRVTLYLNPAIPDHAVTDSRGTRITEGLLVLGPLALAVVILIIGINRRRVARRNFLAFTGERQPGEA